MRLLDPAPPANLIWLDRVDSTNDVAARLLKTCEEADQEVTSATVIVAGEQTRGHGRGDNAWVSPAGGLYCTWLGKVGANELTTLPMAVGVVCAESLEQVCPGLRVGLKWPNDLVHEGKKLGGAVCHARGSGDRMCVRIGVGINLEVTPRLARNDPTRAVSLRELGWKGKLAPTIWTIVGMLVDGLPGALDRPEDTRARWGERLIHRPGELLRVRLEERVVTGRFLSVTAAGHLEVEVEGHVEVLASGDLIGPLSAPEV